MYDLNVDESVWLLAICKWVTGSRKHPPICTHTASYACRLVVISVNPSICVTENLTAHGSL